MGFELDPNYKQVPERLADLKAKHPDGFVRVLDETKPYTIEVVDGRTFIVVVAACYRSPDDAKPATGMAWEPFPGRTPYTKDSELQNAETSAWGRAIVAALASESKAIASAEDVRNRRAEEDFEQAIPAMTSSQQTALAEGIEHLSEAAAKQLAEWWKEQDYPSFKSKRLTREQADAIIAYLPKLQDAVDAEVS